MYIHHVKGGIWKPQQGSFQKLFFGGSLKANRASQTQKIFVKFSRRDVFGFGLFQQAKDFALYTYFCSFFFELRHLPESRCHHEFHSLKLSKSTYHFNWKKTSGFEALR